jgi:hypothetical protein
MAITQEELAVIQRTPILRAMSAADELLTEFRCREMSEEAEQLIEEIRLRLRERLSLLIPLPDVRHSGK